MNDFKLDQRLENDTLPVITLSLCRVLLINDARWPWLVLVPARPGLVEIIDLGEDLQQQLAAETALASKVLKSVTRAEKINTGALGNIVRQLHIHVISRRSGDANWPGPVWGFGTAEPWQNDKVSQFIVRLKSGFNEQIV